MLGVAAALVQHLLFLAGLLPTESHDFLTWPATLTGAQRWVLVLEIVVVGPVAKEILFRHPLWTRLEPSWRPGWVVVATTLVFAATHGLGATAVLPLGLLLGWLRLRTGSVATPSLSQRARSES